METPEAIGALGVGLLLAAFALSSLGRLERRSRLYLSLNLVGAGLACWASYLIGFLPFVVLEGVWALVAGLGLARRVRS